MMSNGWWKQTEGECGNCGRWCSICAWLSSKPMEYLCCGCWQRRYASMVERFLPQKGGES